MPYFSVIIPVYNSDIYIQECLLSVMQQSFNDYEVIIIDDGSTDRSAKIIQELMRTNNRIHYYYQENQGVSVARNYGIKKARGKYILFIDSDDYIDKNTLSIFYSNLKSCEPDIGMGGTREFDSIRIKPNYAKLSNYIPTLTLHDGVYIYAQMMENKSFIPMACNNVYKKEYIDRTGLIFHSILYEDALWTAECLLDGSKVLIIDFDFYYYRKHADSRSHTAPFNKIYHSTFFINHQLESFLNKPDIPAEIKGWIGIQIFVWFLHTWKYFNAVRLYMTDWPMLGQFESLKKLAVYFTDQHHQQYKFLSDSIRSEMENYRFRKSSQDSFIFHSFTNPVKKTASIYYLKENINQGDIHLYITFLEKYQSLLNCFLLIISSEPNNLLLKSTINTIHIEFIDINHINTNKIYFILKNNKIKFTVIQDKIALLSLDAISQALKYLKSNPCSFVSFVIRNTLSVHKSTFKKSLASVDDTSIKELINTKCDPPYYNPYRSSPIITTIENSQEILDRFFSSNNPYTLRYDLYSLFKKHKDLYSAIEIIFSKSPKIHIPKNRNVNPYLHSIDTKFANEIHELINHYQTKTDYSLFEGNMGFSFFLFLCSVYLNNKEYAEKALSLIADFFRQIHSYLVSPAGYNVVSICNSLNYLQHKSILNANANFLNDMDDYYCNFVRVGNFNDYSYEKGISGIGTYLINRLNNSGIHISHKNKLTLSIHILIDRITHFIHSVDLLEFTLHPNEIVDLSLFLSSCSMQGINTYLCLEALKKIRKQFPNLEKTIACHQKIRKFYQQNDLPSIIKIADYQIKKINNRTCCLKNGLLESYLWKLSRFFGFNINWWSIY